MRSNRSASINGSNTSSPGWNHSPCSFQRYTPLRSAPMLAEIEWQFRKERQEAGIAVAKKRGVYKGRKAGTTKGKPERAVELHGKGLTVGEIATALGVSVRTVFRYVGQSDQVASRLSPSS